MPTRRWIARTVAAVAVTAVLATVWVGCSAHDKLDGPLFGHPGPGVIGGGTSSSSSGAGGGDAGQGGGDAGTDAPPPPDCACVIRRASGGATCTACADTAGAPQGACVGELAQCQSDQGCAAILSCLSTKQCKTAACVYACVGPINGSADTWATYEDCLCLKACPIECDAKGACP